MQMWVLGTVQDTASGPLATSQVQPSHDHTFAFCGDKQLQGHPRIQGSYALSSDLHIFTLFFLEHRTPGYIMCLQKKHTTHCPLVLETVNTSVFFLPDQEVEYTFPSKKHCVCPPSKYAAISPNDSHWAIFDSCLDPWGKSAQVFL